MDTFRAAADPEGTSAVIGVDVGGTKVRAAVIDEDGRLVGDTHTFNPCSEKDAETILQALSRGIGRVLHSAPQPISGVGIAMPGLFDYQRGISYIGGLAKYEALYGMNVGEALRKRLDLDSQVPLLFVNDAMAFGLGEWAYGSARPYRRVMGITLGTGCGAAFLQDGRLLHEGPGIPADAEVFHLPCRDRLLEDFISRRGLLSLWRERCDQGSARAAPSLKELRTTNQAGSTHQLDVIDLARAAKAGDPAVRELFTDWGALLAECLGPVVQAFKPACLVVGGSIALSFELFGGAFTDGLRLIAPDTVVLPAQDVHTAAVKGAAYYVSKSRRA